MTIEIRRLDNRTFLLDSSPHSKTYRAVANGEFISIFSDGANTPNITRRVHFTNVITRAVDGTIIRDGSNGATITQIVQSINEIVNFSGGSVSIAIPDNLIFADAAARDAYFPSRLDELITGLEIILEDNGESPSERVLQRWLGANNPSTYPSNAGSFWHTLGGDELTASEIKTLYESNSNTNALTDADRAILDNLSLDNGQIRSDVTFIFPPGSVRIGDGIISSAARSASIRSASTGNMGLFNIQLFNDTQFSKSTTFDNTQVSATFDIQTTLENINSGTTETNIRQVVQNATFFRRIRFKPQGGTVTSNFTFEIRLAQNGEPVYSETVQPSDLTNLGNGVFELNLENPSIFDALSSVYIRIAGISLLGGAFDGSDNVRFGDATKSNFFPWLQSVSIPVVRQNIVDEDGIVGVLNSKTGDDRLDSTSIKGQIVKDITYNNPNNFAQVSYTDDTTSDLNLGDYRTLYDFSQSSGNLSLDVINRAIIVLGDANNTVTIPQWTPIGDDFKTLFINKGIEKRQITISKTGFTYLGGDTSYTLEPGETKEFYHHSNVLYPISGIEAPLPEADHTIFLRHSGIAQGNGNHENYPLNTFALALTAAGAYPSANHKAIISREVYDYNEDITAVSNLIIDAPWATVNNVDLSNHIVTCRLRKANKITVGANCDVDIQSLGHEATDGLRFPNGITHSRTRIRIHGVESPSTIDFTGATGRIRIEVEEYNSSIDTVLSTITSGLTVTGYIGNYNFDNVFGQDFEQFNSLNESSTSLTTLQNKLDITTGTKRIGQYRVSFNCEIANSNVNKYTEIKISVDGSSISQHSSGDDVIRHSGVSTNEWHTLSRTVYIPITSPRTVDLNIEFRTESGGTAKISNASIEIWRVS